MKWRSNREDIGMAMVMEVMAMEVMAIMSEATMNLFVTMVKTNKDQGGSHKIRGPIIRIINNNFLIYIDTFCSCKN